MGEADPCDTGVNVYRGDTHFIERDFLLEDGTIDYQKWISITDPALSPCDPLNNRVPETAPPANPAQPIAPDAADPDAGTDIDPQF